MKLTEYLDSSGFTKSGLARALDVSRAAVGKWDEIPEGYLSQLEGLEPEVDIPMAKESFDWKHCDIDEIRKICKRRGGLEGSLENEFETDWEISRSLGLSIWDFNRMILRLRHV